MASSTDKAREARYKASKSETDFAASDTVNRNAKAAKVNLTINEEIAAKKAIKGNMKAERERTASRGEFIANRDEVNAAKARSISAVTGITPSVTNGVLTKRHPDNQNNAGKRK